MVRQQWGDELPVGSVIYVGRSSFRMEAVAFDAEGGELGVVQPVTGIVTAPLHATPLPEPHGAAPALRPLFGSQVDVPVLAAPTGAVSLHAPVVTISRAMLATACAVVLLCGIIVGTAARHLLASPASSVVATAPIASAPAAVPVMAPPPAVQVLSRAAAADGAPPSPAPVVALPAPVTIRAHARAVAKSAPPNKPVVAPPPKAWVDPWAE